MVFFYLFFFVFFFFFLFSSFFFFGLFSFFFLFFFILFFSWFCNLSFLFFSFFRNCFGFLFLISSHSQFLFLFFFFLFSFINQEFENSFVLARTKTLTESTDSMAAPVCVANPSRHRGTICCDGMAWARSSRRSHRQDDHGRFGDSPRTGAPALGSRHRQPST